MRAHRMVLNIARAAISEQEREDAQKVFDDKPTTAITAMGIGLNALGATKELKFGQNKAELAQQKMLYEEDPDLYKSIYGDKVPGERDLGFFEKGGIFRGGGLIDRMRQDEPVLAPLTNTNDLSFNVGDYNTTEDFLASVEGFSEKAYWDVNAYRVGYGTDTVIDAKGDSSSVRRRTKITEADARSTLGANLDTTFRAELRTKFGADVYDALPSNVKIGLESLAYNAGSDLNDKDGKLKEAILAGNFNKAADLISGQVGKDSDLYGRRQKEAAFLRGHSIERKQSDIDSQKDVVLGEYGNATAEDVAERNRIKEKYNLTEDDFTPEKPPSWYEKNILAPSNDFALDNIFGMDREEYDMFVENNLITTDEDGKAILSPTIYEGLNNSVDIWVNWWKETQLGTAIKNYNNIINNQEKNNTISGSGFDSYIDPNEEETTE